MVVLENRNLDQHAGTHANLPKPTRSQRHSMTNQRSQELRRQCRPLNRSAKHESVTPEDSSTHIAEEVCRTEPGAEARGLPSAVAVSTLRQARMTQKQQNRQHDLPAKHHMHGSNPPAPYWPIGHREQTPLLKPYPAPTAVAFTRMHVSDITRSALAEHRRKTA